jgi:ribosomal protein S18 acetylase RimI-like enzyme
MEAARTAGRQDIARVVELARAATQEMREGRGGVLWSQREGLREPLEPAFTALLDDARALLVVGTIDEQVVGFGTVEVEDLPDGGRLGVVRELYVEPEAREVAVGEAMADRLVSFCRDSDCSGIDAYALPGNRAAKNFFETNGFTARLLVMHRRLDGERSEGSP